MKVFISLADRSAANYVYEIFKEGFEDIYIEGLTDERLESIGIKKVSDYRDIAVVGIFEAIKKIPKALKITSKIKESLRNTDVLILCDAPALNLRILKYAKETGVKKIIYFISPQVWAWKPKRAEIIGNYVDHIIVILPFEVDIYKKFPNLKVHYVGHPLVDLVKPKNNIKSSKPLLPLLLGSRKSEVSRHVKVFKNEIEELKRDFRVICPTFEEFKKEIEENLGIETLTYDKASYDCFFSSEASIIASGTASLEAGIAGNPHVVYYRVNPLTYFIGKRLVKVPYVSLINILKKKKVVPELIQKSGNEIIKEFFKLYERRDKVKEELEDLKEILGGNGVITRLRETFKEVIYY